MRIKKPFLWLSWTAITLTMAAYLTVKWNSGRQTLFLPGKTSHGHYQIELRCDACHTPWNGVKENACYNCHADELKLANDSHPKSKFSDPRNADRLSAIDASNCITCHREHVPEQTPAMGVTVPDDICYHCHQQTLRDRPSHKDFPFDSCSTAGCHNYHDNTALYEDFLRKHLNEPDVAEKPIVPQRALLSRLAELTTFKKRVALTGADHDAPAKPDVEVLRQWARTAHAAAGVNCSDCHSQQNPETGEKIWSDDLSYSGCSDCHAEETKGFLGGRHGMRLAQGLLPMQPAMARLPMKAASMHRDLDCASCHGAHEFDTRSAATDACLRCHNDEHSLAYQSSAHFKLWRSELADETPAGSGVSCATCHLPREERALEGATNVFVEHNQNANLRPNEKMIRQVCLRCHGLGFTLDALADSHLIKKNFRGRPKASVRSLRLVEERARELNKRPRP